MRKQCCKINCNPSGMRAPPARSDGSWRCGNGDENRVLLRVQIYPRTLYTYAHSAYVRILTGEQSLVCTWSACAWEFENPMESFISRPRPLCQCFVYCSRCVLRCVRACVRTCIAHMHVCTLAHTKHTHTHTIWRYVAGTQTYTGENGLREMCVVSSELLV